MNQTLKNGKKNLASGPMLVYIWAQKIYFMDFTSIGC